MRAVLDTNVLLSGLLWRGAPHAVIEKIRSGVISLVSSPALITELAGIVRRAKLRTALVRSGTDPDRVVAEVRFLAEMVDPLPLTVPICRDPDDDAVLALAAAAQADFIVSGDSDLLILGSYARIRIVTPAQVIEMVEE